MINTPTVLILGAGSSQHCGYPFGSQLINIICDKNRLDNLSDIARGSWSGSEVREFIKVLARSSYSSIDAFLEDNRDFRDIGKFAIAYTLKCFEDVYNLFPPNESGWYKDLFNCLVDKGEENIDKNKVTIITFNYDRSLECYLHHALINRFRKSGDDEASLLNKIRIIHLHGILGNYPEENYCKPIMHEGLLKISQGIIIIDELNDSKDQFCTNNYQIAHEALKNAERIFFLGFGFHEDNIRRFQFFTPASIEKPLVRSTTYGLPHLDRVKLIDRLRKYGFKSEMFPTSNPTCNNFFHIVESLD